MPLRTFVSMLRIVYAARSEDHARRTADWFAAHVEKTTEPDDDVSVTQVIPYGSEQVPDEQINYLKRARNELIRLKYKDTMYLAEELDKVICKLQAMAPEETEIPPGYDYNRIDTIMHLINQGEEPLI